MDGALFGIALFSFLSFFRDADQCVEPLPKAALGVGAGLPRDFGDLYFVVQLVFSFAPL